MPSYEAENALFLLRPCHRGVGAIVEISCVSLSAGDFLLIGIQHTVLTFMVMCLN